MTKAADIMAAATPGPWERRFGSLYPPKAQPGAKPVEMGEGAAFYGIWPILSGENAEADARAIVTAVNLFPLYEAVREAAETYVDLFHHMNYPDTAAMYPANLRAALDALQAAEDAL